MGGGLLGIYMNDELALGYAYRELARRAARSNRGTAAEPAIRFVARGIDDDIRTFRSLMQRLGYRISSVKPGLAMAGERVSRLKLNGRLVAYSPLSRFVELDVLVFGLMGKVTVWRTLGDLADLRSRLPDVDFDELIRGAEAQRDAIEPFREQAGRHALRAVEPSAEGSRAVSR